jgi:2,4-dienoyl-CoA reductase-like NADH-dependent reductase (Old Yellow Enzyme family)
MSSLFQPLVAGDLVLPNRVVMAPLTRLRATLPGHVPNALMAEYYAQRASAGLILSEATPVTRSGIGYEGVPGVWNGEQIEGWRKVTTAVHERGGRIALQLWHVGRISDPHFLDGELPVAPSAIAPKGHVSLLRPQRPYVVPRALERDEIADIVEHFRRGAQNALEAGFDAVEIHGANGYLLDQFLHDSSNKRTDDYGGSIENRARLHLEVTDAVVSVFGAGRVGMHLAPRGDVHDVGDTDLAGTFGYLARELGKKKIAFLCVRENQGADSLGPELKAAFGGAYIANEGFTQASAEQALRDGWADAVAFGKAFIANPDLPERFRTGSPLNAPVPETFYSHEAEGYVDYPALEAAAA